MAGGPIFPNSAFPVTAGVLYPTFYVGDGANSKQDEGLGVADATTIVADSIWRLRFHMPPSLPTGTGKIRILAMADAVTGVLRLNPKWASVAVGEDPSSATLNAEGNNDITWSTNDDDEYQELKVDLDADTLVASEVVVMDLTIVDTGTTLAVASVLIPSIIWE